MVILVHHLDVFHISTQYFKRCEELGAFTRRNVGIDRAVEEEKGSCDFISMKKCALVDVDILPVPGKAVGSGDGVVGVAPIPLSPVAGD